MNRWIGMDGMNRWIGMDGMNRWIGMGTRTKFGICFKASSCTLGNVDATDLAKNGYTSVHTDKEGGNENNDSNSYCPYTTTLYSSALWDTTHTTTLMR